MLIPMLKLMPMLIQMPMPMPMPMLKLMLNQVHAGRTVLLIMAIIASAPLTTAGTATPESVYATGSAPTATSWTIVAARANAPRSAPTATTWTTIAASALSAEYASASPAPTTTAHSTASAEPTTAHGAARKPMAARGPAIGLANQLQFGWQEWISWNFHHMFFDVLGPHAVIFLLGPHTLFNTHLSCTTTMWSNQ